MKNLKKVLALVLAFACAFTMFAGAAVYPDVPAGSEFSEAISFLSDLGVIQGKDDGKYHPEDTITRAEACALIARMLTGDPDVSKFTGASNFTDVVKNSWKEPAIGYCVANGITVGVGNNKFEPDRAITDAEFVTMVVRAMGYETVGTTYPYGHISAAQANGLLDGVAVVPSSAALRGEDAQIMFNAMFADYARGAKMVNTTHGTTVEEYSTIAEEIWNLAKLAEPKKGDIDFYASDDDDFTCMAHTWVVAGADTRDGDNEYVAYKIDDKKNELDKDVSVTIKYEGDASAILGYQVELWGDVSHTGDDKVVAAIKTVKGQTGVEWNPSMDNDGTKAIVGEEKYQTKTAAMPERKTMTEDKIEGVFTNTKKNSPAFDLVTGAKIMDKMEVKDGNVYRLCDWDSDGDVDFVIADIAKYAKVSSLTNKRIGLQSMDGKEGFNLDLDNDKLVVEVDEAVEKDDVVEIQVTDRSWTKSDKEVVTISLTKVESDVKELTKLSTKKAPAYYDDEPIEEAVENAWDFIAIDEENRGSEYTLHLNRNGLIIKSEEGDTGAAGYLMILDTGKGSTATNNRKLATVDVMYGTGEDAGKYVEDVKVVKDLDIDVKNAYDEDTRAFNERMVVGQVFKYYLNEDGEIKKLKEATDTNADKYTYKDNWDRLTVDSKNYAVKDADVIFVMEANAIVGDDDDHGAEVSGDWKYNWHIDDDMVAVLSAEDLEDLEDMGVGDDFLDTSKIKNFDSDSWLKNTDGVAMKDVNIAFKADDNKDVSAVIFGVKDIGAFKNSVKIALVTDVTYDKDGVVAITAAMDNKVEEFTSDEDEDIEDVVVMHNDSNKFDGNSDSAVMKNIEKFLGDGAYAEVTFDKDGKITEVQFLSETKDGAVLTGDHFMVMRHAVGNTVKDDKFSVIGEQAVFASEDEIYFIDSKADVAGYETDEDTVFFTIDGKPQIKGAKSSEYNGKKVLIANNFDDELKLSAEKTLNATINDSDDNDGDYYFADVAIKLSESTEETPVAAGVFGFTDALYEEDGAVVLADSEVTFEFGTEETKNVEIVIPAKGTVTVEDGEKIDGLKVSVADDKVKVEYTSADAGTYKFAVKSKGYKDATLTVVVNPAKATVNSAEYSANAVKVFFSSKEAAAEFAKNPKLFSLTKDGNKVEGKAVRQGRDDETVVMIKVDMADVTSAEEVKVVVLDSTNYNVNNEEIKADYNETLKY